MRKLLFYPPHPPPPRSEGQIWV